MWKVLVQGVSKAVKNVDAVTYAYATDRHVGDSLLMSHLKWHMQQRCFVGRTWGTYAANAVTGAKPVMFAISLCWQSILHPS